MKNKQRCLKGYYNLIEHAKSQNRIKGDVYYENHHIIPKVFGGKKIKSNMILLTAKEHYVAHYLLARFTSGNQNTKMLSAFNIMSRVGSKSPRDFETLKQAYSKNHHMKNKSFVNDKYTGINNVMSGVYTIYNEKNEPVMRTESGFASFCKTNNLPYKHFCRSYKNNEIVRFSQPWQTNPKYLKYEGWRCEKYSLKQARKEYEEHYAEYHKQIKRKIWNKNMSLAHKGKIFSEEHKKNISKAKKGKPAWNKGLKGQK